MASITSFSTSRRRVMKAKGVSSTSPPRVLKSSISLSFFRPASMTRVESLVLT